MFTESSGSTKIDRLSSLPPELLSDIFDLAHDPEHPLIESLSRTLLPYHRQTLYRQIRISSFSSLLKLLESVNFHPPLGILVFSLDTSEIRRGDGGHRCLKRLLSPLPSLRSLSIHHLETFEPTYYALPLLAPNLDTISISCTYLSPSDVGILSRLNALKSVAISFGSFIDGFDLTRAGSPSKPFLDVRKLSITSLDDADWADCWREDLARFVNKFFPRITRLCLRDDDYADYRTFLSTLETISTSVESLVLESGEQDDYYGISCQHLLPRFKRLKHLELGEGTVSSPFATYLQQLPSLRTLRLAPRTNVDGLTLEDVLSVIDGPSRTTSLRVLVVDSIPDTMSTGRRVNLDDSQSAASRSLFADGWSPREPGIWNLENLKALSEAGVRNGVEVKGSTFGALKVWRMTKLEESNRLILRVYHSKSLDEYALEKANRDPNPRLPDLYFDQLDFANLKLVKLNLPEEDWFQLTLG